MTSVYLNASPGTYTNMPMPIKLTLIPLTKGVPWFQVRFACLHFSPAQKGFIIM